jgi:hypothetical protein
MLGAMLDFCAKHQRDELKAKEDTDCHGNGHQSLNIERNLRDSQTSQNHKRLSQTYIRSQVEELKRLPEIERVELP